MPGRNFLFIPRRIQNAMNVEQEDMRSTRNNSQHNC